ncbi:MAG TPA: MarR family transcriptional regulator [Sphingobacteriaceae bacterium]|nr:MarR family transcriptional regulator [Sphingobacteriaceae bacterium]
MPLQDRALEPEVHSRHVERIEAHLRHIAFIVRKRGRSFLNNFDITSPQFEALMVLDRHDNIAMGELCNRLKVASSTITDLVDRLEKSGLATRVRDPDDRRVIRLQILPKGRKLIDGVLSAWRTYLSGVLAGSSVEELEQLVSSLEYLDDLLTKKESGAP